MKRVNEPQRHIVVFDCNIYLDVACLVGEPFSWDAFSAQAAKHSSAPVPHPADAAVDSLRSVASCSSGLFAGKELLEVWCSAHINATVLYKSMQSPKPDPMTGHRGLGWSRESAEALVSDLVVGITQKSNGGDVGDRFPDGNPPLDHEDGLVYGACRFLAGEDPLSTVYCVTRDQGFLAAYRGGRLAGHTKVLAPHVFVSLIRAARLHYAMPGVSSRRP